MEEILEDINAVAGVIGCCLYDSEGQVTASALPDLFDETILSTVGLTLTQTIAGVATARRRKVGDIDLVYREGRVVVKNLGEACLCVLCLRQINVPLLNLTANVAARKLVAKIREQRKEPDDLQE